MNKFKVRIIGEKGKVRYYVSGWFGRQSISKRYVDVEDNLLWEGEIEHPRLEVDEKIYIDSKTIYKIKDVARNIEGGYICWVDDMEEIRDEETELSRIKAELKLDESKRRQKEQDEEWNRWNEERKKEMKKKEKRKWYHIFD